MRAALSTADGKATLQDHGLTPPDIGVHSVRKGSASYTLSGSTASPSQNSVRRRAGWKYATSEERYLQDEAAGDQYCGRTVAGLNIMSAEFAALPPHFPPNSIATETFDSLFPAFSGDEQFRGVLSLLLASAVHHVPFLRQSFPRRHKIFSSALFSEKRLLKDLTQEVHFGISSPHLRATGLPPHIAIVLELQGIKSGLENLAPTLVEEIGQTLEKNGAAAANITPEGLKIFLQNTLAQLIPQYVQTQAPAAVAPEEPVQSGYGLYAWGGSLHRLPEDFKFPDVTLASGFRLWHQGSTEENLPPFKTLEPSDFSVKNERKRLSDWKYLMTSLTEALDEDDMVTDCEPENFSLDLLNSQFKLAMERIPVNEKKKRTRPSEWKVVTAVREVRAAKRSRLEEDNEDSS